MSGPAGIAIDGAGDAWITNSTGETVSELSNAGAVLSGTTGYTSTDLAGPTAIAIDGTGNAWVANAGGVSVTELSNAGTVLSGATGYFGGGIYAPGGIAIDGNGHAWVANLYGDSHQGAGSVTELDSGGNIWSGPNGFTGGGMQNPGTVAIDGAGNAWVTDVSASSNRVVEFPNSGAAPLSGTNGYLTPAVNSSGGGVAVDGSGNVWIAFTQSNAVAELVGAGVPVVTPLAVGVLNSTLGSQP
jgi:hypothetical protein